MSEVPLWGAACQGHGGSMLEIQEGHRGGNRGARLRWEFLRSEEPKGQAGISPLSLYDLLVRIHFIIVMMRWTGLAPGGPRARTRQRIRRMALRLVWHSSRPTAA